MKYIIVFVSLFFMACNEVHKSPKPDYLIEKDEMIDIMYDIKLITAARSKNYKKLKDSAVQADLFIYNKYKIDSTILRQNLDYYANRSFKKYKDMEHEVKLRFEAEKKKIQKEIKTSDSLKKTPIKENVNIELKNDSVFKKDKIKQLPKKQKRLINTN